MYRTANTFPAKNLLYVSSSGELMDVNILFFHRKRIEKNIYPKIKCQRTWQLMEKCYGEDYEG